MNIPKLAIGTAILLVLLGVIGYLATGMVSLTALTPAFFGVFLAASGILALKKPELRKHMMHAAAGISLFGIVGCYRGLLQVGNLFAGKSAHPAAVILQSLMAIICIVFLAFCIKSFIDARRGGKA